MTLTQSVPSNFGKKWTTEDEELLTSNYGKKPYKELAKVLDRTYDGVRRKADALGIRKKSHPSQKRQFVILEKTVKAHVAQWLTEQGWFFVEEWRLPRLDSPIVDFYLESHKVIIECKGFNGSVSASTHLSYLLGQLLVYNYLYLDSKVYCAIPDRSKALLKRLKTLFTHYNMPFGILIVSKHRVTVEKDPYGFFAKKGR